jgi:hypothetical protein
MKLTISSTSQIVTVNGSIQARVWEGKTESGIPVQCLIAQIAVDVNLRQEDFERELKETESPAPSVSAFPFPSVILISKRVK